MKKQIIVVRFVGAVGSTSVCKIEALPDRSPVIKRTLKQSTPPMNMLIVRGILKVLRMVLYLFVNRNNCIKLYIVGKVNISSNGLHKKRAVC